MSKLNNIFIVLLLSVTFPTQSAISEETRIVKPRSPSITIHQTVAGSTIGQLYLNAPLEVVGNDGTWTKVKLEAWVKSNDIADVASQTIEKKPSPESLTILDHKIQTYSDPINKVYLALSVKNTGSSTINSWQAFLVAKDVSNREIFRSVIADDKVILPGQSQETGFYWESDEPAYDFLKGAKKEDFSFSIEGAILK